MPLWEDDYPRSEEELAKETYLYRRSDAFGALGSWFSSSLNEEKIMHREDKAVVEPPDLAISLEAKSSLLELVHQFELNYRSWRKKLCSDFANASSELSSENYEVIDCFSMRMKTFAQTVVDFAVKKLEEGMEIIKNFQTEHGEHQQYRSSLSFLMLVHSYCCRKITDRVSSVVNGHEIDFQQYLEPLEPELKRKAQQKMEEAGLKSVL